MVLVGQAWKLTDAPAPGDIIDPTVDPPLPADLAVLVKKLSDLDSVPVPQVQPGKANPAIVKHMLERVSCSNRSSPR